MIKSFYLHKLVYYIAGLAAVVFVTSYFFPQLYRIGLLILLLMALAMLVDGVLLYSKKNALEAERILSERFSIGDPNKIFIRLRNNYPFPIRASIIDEIPVQFQDRNWLKKTQVSGQSENELHYTLTPLSRGEYYFHDINVYAHGPLQLVRRRFIFPAQQVVKVYPSYVQMRKYQLLAVSNRLQEVGVKRIRKIGHSMEFEQIK